MSMYITGHGKKFDAAIFEHFHPKDGFQKPKRHHRSGKNAGAEGYCKKEKNRLETDELFLKK